MVLWEITLATAYFLGIQRTYKLALRIQRRVITPKHPKTRQFVQRRIRAIFDVAVSVHQNIQQRDIEVGRNLGNWILRWLDRMKPSAEIRGPMKAIDGNWNVTMTKQATNPLQVKSNGGSQTSSKGNSGRHLFASSANLFAKPFPTISMMIRRPWPAGNMNHFRHFSAWEPDMLKSNYGRQGSEGVFREDIMQWMLRN
ncbi:hypothetical protein HS088_TW15G00544 [Tripterygium wilfordii]|uniref:Uncharacterized protein n=1 Tax=Tripterygium wilfordii TaxID=458696 RepID=A0A7J7CLV0_TRIWF|nr:uncharacterized protein LOC120016633 [Tripterygium wilfordii]KAF5735045.1 hypothetical protein HS088_TW15G00544 [Tripterygium wilfordii]